MGTPSQLRATAKAFMAEVWLPLLVLSLLTLVTYGLCRWHSYQPGFHRRWSAATKPPTLTDDEKKTIIEDRSKRYADNAGSLALTVKLMLSFVAVGLIAVTRKDKEMKVPWVDTKVPVSWLYASVPIGLIYLWLTFGYLLNDIINSRAALWLLQPPFDPHATTPFTLRSLLDDGNFIDGYFLTSIPDLQAIREQMQWVNRFALFGYVLVLTMTHAVALSLVYLGSTRDAVTLRWFLPFVAVGLILAGTHYQFWMGGPNPNLVQMMMACLIVPCWLSFTFLGWNNRRHGPSPQVATGAGS